MTIGGWLTDRGTVLRFVGGLMVVLALVSFGTLSGADEAPVAARILRVRVTSEDGAPLHGAQIHAAIWAKDPAKSNRDYQTNAEGEAFIELPPSIQILRLWATKKGRVGKFAQWWPAREKAAREIPEDYAFELERGTVIGGIVTNDAGEPLEGVKVSVQLTDPTDESVLDRQAIPNRWLALGDNQPTTDAEGRWMLDNVPAGDRVRVQVLLSHPDQVSESEWGSLQVAQGVTTEQFRDRTAKIAMHRGVRLGGFVFDVDRMRVEGAVVIWGNDPYFETGSQEVRSDAKGHYRLPPLPEGKIMVTVVAEGWAPQQEEVDLKSDRSLNFKLDRGKTIRFKFLDEKDKPVPNVGVQISEWRGARALYNHRHPNVLDTKIPVQSDEAGIYEWSWAPADGVTYRFYKDGYGQAPEVEYTAGGVYVVRLRKLN